VRPLIRNLGQHLWPATAGLLLGLLALGPALSRGFVLSYDMVFVPHPPLTVADLGFSGGPPRAVPSDLVVALTARVLPADILQKLILLGIFVLASAGAAALLTSGLARRTGPPPLSAQLAAGVFYAWNPFVAERLIMGQWAMLLGYAGLPWLLRELASGGERVLYGRVALAALPAAVGGFAAMTITVLAAVPVALANRDGWRDRARDLAIALAILAALSLPWLVPAVIVPVHADPAGALVFAARADTPFGTGGSLFMLGGIWNGQAVPAGYDGPAAAFWLAVVVIAAASYVLVARKQHICPGLGWAAIAGGCLAAIGLFAATRAVLHGAIGAWPGFAMLRDGQQFIAPLALADSIGLGAGVAALRPNRVRAAGPVAALGVLAVLAPVVLLPGMAWGSAGRLRAMSYPADWLRARSMIEGSRLPGSVLLLPWAQYRRYPWNNAEAVYDPWPRLTSRSMIWNDALQVGRITLAAESPQSRRLGPVMRLRGPLTAALVAAGVRYVLVDSGPLLGMPEHRLAALARLPGAAVLLASRDLILYLLPSPVVPRPLR
jgi:hypothetical protein